MSSPSSLLVSGISVPGVASLRPREEAWLLAVANGDEHATRRAWLAPLNERVLEAGLEHLLDHGPDDMVEELLPLLPATLDWDRLTAKALDVRHDEVLPFWLPRCSLTSASGVKVVQAAVHRGDRPLVRQVLETLLAQAHDRPAPTQLDWHSLVKVSTQWATEHRPAMLASLLTFDPDGSLADGAFKLAARLGRRDDVEALLPGRSLNALQSALAAAVEEGHGAVVERLLPHAQLAVHPINLLEPAVRRGDVEMVNLLVPHVSPHLFESSALALAAEQNNRPMLDALLAHAHPERVPSSVLHRAARHNCDRVLDWGWPHVQDAWIRQRLMFTAFEGDHHGQAIKRLSGDELEALGHTLRHKRQWEPLDKLGAQAPLEHVLAWLRDLSAEEVSLLPRMQARQLSHIREGQATASQVTVTRPRHRP